MASTFVSDATPPLQSTWKRRPLPTALESAPRLTLAAKLLTCQAYSLAKKNKNPKVVPSYDRHAVTITTKTSPAGRGPPRLMLVYRHRFGPSGHLLSSPARSLYFLDYLQGVGGGGGSPARQGAARWASYPCYNRTALTSTPVVLMGRGGDSVSLRPPLSLVRRECMTLPSSSCESIWPVFRPSSPSGEVGGGTASFKTDRYIKK